MSTLFCILSTSSYRPVLKNEFSRSLHILGILSKSILFSIVITHFSTSNSTSSDGIKFNICLNLLIFLVPSSNFLTFVPYFFLIDLNNVTNSIHFLMESKYGLISEGCICIIIIFLKDLSILPISLNIVLI